MTALYGSNLALISVLNTILWVMAAAPRREWHVTVAPVFRAVIFIIAAVVGLVAPQLTKFLWPLAFGSPILAAYVERGEKPTEETSRPWARGMAGPPPAACPSERVGA